MVNGGKDRLYPISIVEPFTRHLMKNGVQIDYHPQPDGEHNTKWWPEIKGPFEKFVADHPRDPHPDKLTWEAADAANNRAHWLVIDAFWHRAGRSQAAAPTSTSSPIRWAPIRYSAGRRFPGEWIWSESGNTVQATTKGVTAFTLLLSPDKFDFNQPVIVTANGREVFHARVQPSVETLLKWAARDNDRTMLYAAEIKIKLK